jgi:hypothetical protein
MAPNDKLPIWPDAARANARRSVLAGDLVIEVDVTSEGSVNVQGRIVTGSSDRPARLKSWSPPQDGSKAP